MKFRKKPVVIEAIQWNGLVEDIVQFMDGQEDVIFDNKDGTLDIPTKEGVMKANQGDWIIRGVAGEHYPCKPDIFSVTYAAADTAPDRSPVEEELLDALKDIANPIAVIRADADARGLKLDGLAVNHLINDPNWLKEKARKAIAAAEHRKEGT